MRLNDASAAAMHLNEAPAAAEGQFLKEDLTLESDLAKRSVATSTPRLRAAMLEAVRWLLPWVVVLVVMSLMRSPSAMTAPAAAAAVDSSSMVDLSASSLATPEVSRNIMCYDYGADAQHPLVLDVPAATQPECTAPTAARALRHQLDPPFPIAPPLAYDATMESCQWAGEIRVALIHVGKTGGKSIELMLEQAGLSVTFVHEGSFCGAGTWIVPAQAALACNFTHYIVTTRDPVDRLVSAYEFMGWAVTRPDSTWRTPALVKFYEECFPQLPDGLGTFADALTSATACGALARSCLFEPTTDCGHLSHGMAYYLRDTGLLELLRRPDKRLFVVRLDSIVSDVEAMWKWLCVPAARRAPLPDPDDDPSVSLGGITSDYPQWTSAPLSQARRDTLAAHQLQEAHVKATVEGLADNNPSEELRAWASPPALSGAHLECARACGTLQLQP